MEVDEPLPLMLMTSADSHLPAISNELRVRVESSKNRLTTVRPRSVGQLLDLALLHAVHLRGGVEDGSDLLAAQVRGRQQVPLGVPGSPRLLSRVVAVVVVLIGVPAVSERRKRRTLG